MAVSNISEKFTGFLLFFLSLFGFILSMYAFHVGINKQRNPSYTPWCDFSRTMNCSQIFTSRYSRGFGLVDKILSKESIFNQPNSVFAMAFYMMHIFMTLTKSDGAIAMQSLVSLLANFGTIYFFYILFVLQNFCLICVSIYIINALILVCTIYRLISFHKLTIKKVH